MAYVALSYWLFSSNALGDRGGHPSLIIVFRPPPRLLRRLGRHSNRCKRHRLQLDRQPADPIRPAFKFPTQRALRHKIWCRFAPRNLRNSTHPLPFRGGVTAFSTFFFRGKKDWAILGSSTIFSQKVVEFSQSDLFPDLRDLGLG